VRVVTATPDRARWRPSPNGLTAAVLADERTGAGPLATEQVRHSGPLAPANCPRTTGPRSPHTRRRATTLLGPHEAPSSCYDQLVAAHLTDPTALTGGPPMSLSTSPAPIPAPQACCPPTPRR